MKASFMSMAESTAEDFKLIVARDRATHKSLADRILDHLGLEDQDLRAFPINRLQHSLQSADRAQEMGADDDWVFAALLHDIGDLLAPDNHAAMAAAIIEPFVRPEVVFTVRHHRTFQGHYYWHHIGLDRRAREEFRGHPFFAHAVAFCHFWDQCSFDPAYETSRLDDYRGLVAGVCGRKPFSRTEPKGLSAMGIGPAEEEILAEAMKPL